MSTATIAPSAVSKTSRSFPRRMVLRSAGGLALPLPWLASARTRADDSAKQTFAERAAGRRPVRFVCMFFSNGVEPQHWWARGQGADMQLGPGLSPLSALTKDIVVIDGLYHQKALESPSNHLGRMPNLLSGAWVSLDQDRIHVGQSMDQTMAQYLGNKTDLSSLVCGIEPTELRLEDGLSMLYGSCISWETAERPAAREIYPARIFDMLVGRRTRQPAERFVLDQLIRETKAVQNSVSAADRKKLDEYLSAVHTLEKRLRSAKSEGRLEGQAPVIRPDGLPVKADQLPQDIPEHMRLMTDLIVLALQADKTRIVTCMLNNDLSQMNFGFLKHVQGSLHLDLTHNGHDPKLEAMYLKTNQFHVAQFARLVRQLQQIEDGESALLDNCILMLCSNLFDGDTHQADRLPIVLAGRGGGSIKTGRVLDYTDRPDEERRACSLYLSIMDRMQVRLPSFGDSSTRLKEL